MLEEEKSPAAAHGPAPGRTDAVVPVDPKSSIITGQAELSYAGMSIRHDLPPCDFLLFEQHNRVGLKYNPRASKLAGTPVLGNAVVMDIQKSELRRVLAGSKFRPCAAGICLPSPVPVCRRVPRRCRKRSRSPSSRGDMAREAGQSLLRKIVEGVLVQQQQQDVL